jgi:esterase/lipase superfamily enzyme
MRFRAALAFVFFSLVFSSPLEAQLARGQLRHMDTATVRPDSKVIRFDLANTPGRVGAIRLIARKGNVVILRVIVTYANGRVHYEVRDKPINLLEGERTREIDPRSDERFLESVEVEIASASGPMELELHVVQTAEGRTAQRDAASDRSFGEKTAQPRGLTADSEKPWVEVEVFYGTNRKAEKPRVIEISRPAREKRTLLSYGPTPENDLTLGRAVVTIPRKREKGEINTPGTFDVLSYFRGQDMTTEFTLLAVNRMDETQFKAAASARLASAKLFAGQAFVFVHGFNVSFDDAVFRTAQLAHDMDFDGLPLLFSWPSAGSIPGYVLDKDAWRTSKSALRQFLDLVSSQTGATTIHLIAHSMGANPMLETLEGYAGSPQPAGQPRFSELILAAPDMNIKLFEQAAARIRGLTRGITLFASNNDWALVLSGRITRGASPVGFVASGSAPVVTPGVDSIDISAMNSGTFSLGHSTFADRATLINDMKALLLDATRREPSARLNAYRTMPAGSSKFWRYTP